MAESVPEDETGVLDDRARRSFARLLEREPLRGVAWRTRPARAQRPPGMDRRAGALAGDSREVDEVLRAWRGAASLSGRELPPLSRRARAAARAPRPAGLPGRAARRARRALQGEGQLQAPRRRGLRGAPGRARLRELRPDVSRHVDAERGRDDAGKWLPRDRRGLRPHGDAAPGRGWHLASGRGRRARVACPPDGAGKRRTLRLLRPAPLGTQPI